MSCFVMKPEPLTAIGSATTACLNLGFDCWGFEAPYELYNALADCRTCGYYSEQAIYNKLYTLNVKAYCGRYHEPFNPDAIIPPSVDMARYAIHHQPECPYQFTVQPWHYQFAQLLDCYLYQTLEDATYKDPLRLAIVQFRNNLYAFIVTRSPQYAAFRWGTLELESDQTGL